MVSGGRILVDLEGHAGNDALVPTEIDEDLATRSGNTDHSAIDEFRRALGLESVVLRLLAEFLDLGAEDAVVLVRAIKPALQAGHAVPVVAIELDPALFDALDADGSGEIDDEEFIEGLNDFR